MVLIRLDDGVEQGRKLALAGPLAVAMQTAALCYCNRHLTDGFIPEAVARDDLVCWTFEGYLEDLEWLGGEGTAPTGPREFEICWGMGFGGDTVTSEFVVNLLLRHGLWDRTPGGYVIRNYIDFNRNREKVTASRSRAKTQRRGR